MEQEFREEYTVLRKEIFEILKEFSVIVGNIPLRKIVKCQEEVKEYLSKVVQMDDGLGNVGDGTRQRVRMVS